MEPDLHLGVLKEIEELRNESRYREALEVIDSILQLPADLQSAANKIEKYIAEPNSIRLDWTDHEKINSGDYISKGRLSMSGGIIPHLMDLRGSCFVQILSELHNKKSQGIDIFRDSDTEKMFELSLQHAQITGMLLNDYAPALFRAGCICYQCFQAEPSVKIFNRVLELEPENTAAKEMLASAENALKWQENRQ